MPDLFARPVDGGRGRVLKIHVTDAEAAAVDALPRGGLRSTRDGGLTCGPLSGQAVLVAGRYYLRWASCGLPSCCCALQYWGVRRRRPPPPADWAHSEHLDENGEISGCACGRLDELDKYWPKEGVTS